MFLKAKVVMQHQSCLLPFEQKGATKFTFFIFTIIGSIFQRKQLFPILLLREIVVVE